MKINISDIENNEKNFSDINFSEIIEEFNKETPVKAKLRAELIGDIIKITGEISAYVNLVCDKCLKEFTKEINFSVEETYNRYSLEESYSQEFELKSNNFSVDLNGENEIDITDFVYQSVILHIPNKLVCDINCKEDEIINKYIKKEISDPRLEIFKNIKIEKDN